MTGVGWRAWIRGSPQQRDSVVLKKEATSDHPSVARKREGLVSIPRCLVVNRGVQVSLMTQGMVLAT
ncbi:hypothetical protein HYQ44_010297 [Verticillium longisporum]|nr:hypothetical protein HYQ44_010297 [Verticillium longisporum]